MEFCKQYNAATEAQTGTIVPGRDHGLRGPDVHVRPQDAAHAGAAAPGRRPREGLDHAGQDASVGTVTDAQIEEIAKIKMPDLNAYDVEAAKEQVRGTAR